MQTHELQPKHTSKSRKRVGRGGKKGTYSGKGGKGQSARSGRKMVPIIRELIKRYPKLRGYRRVDLRNPFTVINLDILEKSSKDGETITPGTLLSKGLVRAIKGKTPTVKILGRGALSKKLIIEDCQLSETAKKAVEKAGGSIK